MREYWSNSKLADWIRGTEKPYAMELDSWGSWEDEARKASPVRYWIAEEGLDHLQDIVSYIPRRIYDLKYYVNNRWVTRTHSLTAHNRDIKPGAWCDVGNRFLPCLFNELVDFVEVELAWWHIAWDNEARKQYQAPFWARGWFRWRTWRSAQAGLDNLDWQIKLTHGDGDGIGEDHKLYGKPTPQAVRAQEILDLYTWWKCTRVCRPDPYEVSGWTAICESAREINGGRLSFATPKELKKEYDRAHKQLTKMEEQYEAEDEAMMIRLIKIRDALWT
jgi:hypothetical protein